MRRDVDQILAHHQRPKRGNKNQRLLQLSKVRPTQPPQLEAEEVVLIGDQFEVPATTEAVESSDADQIALVNKTPVKRLSKRKTKLPSYLKDFQLN